MWFIVSTNIIIYTQHKKNMALDYFGNEIKIGDTVAFMQTGYRQLMSGSINSITEKNVIIDHERTNVGKTRTKQFHNQVIVKKQ
jgi:hypothetical protein